MLQRLFILESSVVTLCATASSSHATLGDTLRQSQARYGQGYREGDHYQFFDRYGYNITEGFDANGRCNIIMYGHANATNLTVGEVAVFLSENLPAGYQWTRYNGNSLSMPTWACGRFFAMLYVNSWHSRSTGAQGYKQFLRIATDETLASRGYWNGYRIPASRSRS
jgi:hypothetical protein